ncbi:MAG: PKD domain-containing protein, partial [Chitinophagaceae bacterium]
LMLFHIQKMFNIRFHDFSVSLITISSNGCRDTLKKDSLFNFNNIITSFTAPDSVCTGDAVNLSNTSSSPATTTIWNFGDGTTNSTTNAIKTFTTPGDYTIRLTQSYGACSDSAIRVVRVKPRPKADFSPDKSAFCQTPATVNFTNISSNAGFYQWFFGDGSTSTQQSPSHTFTTYGSFTVKLLVTSANGCTDSMTKQVVISKPTISFNGLPKEGCIPYGANFSAAINSSETVASYLWSFGDGGTSNAVNPSHTYKFWRWRQFNC